MNPKQHQKNLRKAPFHWNSSYEEVFQNLKTKFCTAPILKHFNAELETILETDPSNYVVSGIMFQCHPAPNGPTGANRTTLHPVAYLSEKMTSAEYNYSISDKELLAIIACLEKWHMYLHEIKFTIFPDHPNMQNFATKALLNCRQAGWAGQLAQYQF